MINILIGGPGGGKSYEAVAYHVLPALERGRKVVTNMPLNIEAFEAINPDFGDLIDIREKTLAIPPDTSSDSNRAWQIGMINQAKAARFVSRPFANPEDFADSWRHSDGSGVLYVIDECHFVMPRTGTSRAVEEWFSMHRHFNVDVLLITQSSGKISPAIRDLVQVCYKVRKAIGLGKPDGYIRKVLDGVNGGEVSTSQRKYERKYFSLYRSHTQGLALNEQHADDVSPLHVRFKMFSYAFYSIAACVLVYAFWPSDKSKPVASISEAPTPAGARHFLEQGKAMESARAAGGSVLSPTEPMSVFGGTPVEQTDDTEPFAKQTIHITGWMRMSTKTVYTFVVAGSGGRLFELNDTELLKAGYSFSPLGYCSGRLKYGTKHRTVICDPPTVASGAGGRNDAPVVMALGNKGEMVSSRDVSPPTSLSFPDSRKNVDMVPARSY